MDDDPTLERFSKLCRLFPLPRVVLFPHAVLPLHIFEPRYRQMTEDALADDQLVTIVQLRPPARGTEGALGSPPVEEIACVGRILQSERLPDGRFNFLLLGRKRVRLTREIPSQKLYRIAEAEILEDREDLVAEGAHRTELIALFRSVFGERHEIDDDLASILDGKLSMSVLTDIVAHALGLPPEVKQMLLANPDVGGRAQCLLSILLELGTRTPVGVKSPYPPPFSVN